VTLPRPRHGIRRGRSNHTGPLLTLHQIPGRSVVETMVLVTGVAVMSRNFPSDLGSDISSIWRRHARRYGDLDAAGRGLCSSEPVRDRRRSRGWCRPRHVGLGCLGEW